MDDLDRITTPTPNVQYANIDDRISSYTVIIRVEQMYEIQMFSLQRLTMVTWDKEALTPVFRSAKYLYKRVCPSVGPSATLS